MVRSVSATYALQPDALPPYRQHNASRGRDTLQLVATLRFGLLQFQLTVYFLRH